MKELLKRVTAGSPACAGLAQDGVLDPAWLRIWLACYGGSLTVLAAYLLSVVAKLGIERAE